MFVTFFDTCMVSLAAIFVWRIRPYIVILPWLTIACLDATYLSSALTKFPAGAWFTITLAAVLASVLLLWRYGKEQQWSAEAEDRFPTSHFVTKTADGDMQLTDRYGRIPLGYTRGFGIFFDKAGETTPIVFSQFLLKLTALPEVTVFFHLRPLEVPSVAPNDRHTVSKLAIPNCYRLVVRYGYNDEIISPNLASVVFEQVRKFLVDRQHELLAKEELDLSRSMTQPPESVSSGPIDEKKAVNEEHLAVDLATLDSAYAHKVLYIIGKEQMKIKEGTNLFRKLLMSIFLWIRDNTRTKMANLRVPAEKVIEVGFLKEI